MKVSLFIDTLNRKIGIFASWLILILIVIIGLDVAMRSLFNWSSPAIFELQWHLFAAIFLLGMAYTLQKDKHVRVDVFQSRLGDKSKAWIDLLGTLMLLMPFCFVGFYASIDPLIESYVINESSPDPGGLPFRFLVKSLVPFSFIMLMLQGISFMIKRFVVAIT